MIRFKTVCDVTDRTFSDLFRGRSARPRDLLRDLYSAKDTYISSLTDGVISPNPLESWSQRFLRDYGLFGGRASPTGFDRVTDMKERVGA